MQMEKLHGGVGLEKWWQEIERTPYCHSSYDPRIPEELSAQALLDHLADPGTRCASGELLGQESHHFAHLL